MKIFIKLTLVISLMTVLSLDSALAGKKNKKKQNHNISINNNSLEEKQGLESSNQRAVDLLIEMSQLHHENMQLLNKWDQSKDRDLKILQDITLQSLTFLDNSTTVILDFLPSLPGSIQGEYNRICELLSDAFNGAAERFLESVKNIDPKNLKASLKEISNFEIELESLLEKSKNLSENEEEDVRSILDELATVQKRNEAEFLYRDDPFYYVQSYIESDSWGLDHPASVLELSNRVTFWLKENSQKRVNQDQKSYQIQTKNYFKAIERVLELSKDQKFPEVLELLTQILKTIDFYSLESSENYFTALKSLLRLATKDPSSRPGIFKMVEFLSSYALEASLDHPSDRLSANLAPMGLELAKTEVFNDHNYAELLKKIRISVNTAGLTKQELTESKLLEISPLALLYFEKPSFGWDKNSNSDLEEMRRRFQLMNSHEDTPACVKLFLKDRITQIHTELLERQVKSEAKQKEEEQQRLSAEQTSKTKAERKAERQRLEAEAKKEKLRIQAEKKAQKKALKKQQRENIDIAAPELKLKVNHNPELKNTPSAPVDPFADVEKDLSELQFQVKNLRTLQPLKPADRVAQLERDFNTLEDLRTNLMELAISNPDTKPTQSKLVNLYEQILDLLLESGLRIADSLNNSSRNPPLSRGGKENNINDTYLNVKKPLPEERGFFISQDITLYEHVLKLVKSQPNASLDRLMKLTPKRAGMAPPVHSPSLPTPCNIVPNHTHPFYPSTYPLPQNPAQNPALMNTVAHVSNLVAAPTPVHPVVLWPQPQVHFSAYPQINSIDPSRIQAKLIDAQQTLIEIESCRRALNEEANSAQEQIRQVAEQLRTLQLFHQPPILPMPGAPAPYQRY